MVSKPNKGVKSRDTHWPASCPLAGEEYFISIGCGNSTIHWALHHTLTKYDTQQNLQPVIMWKTPHIMPEDLDGNEANVLARLLPRKLQQYFFGENGTYTKEVAEEVSKNRGFDITYYIISSNDEQAACIFRLLESVPSRVFRMKGEDFYSATEGRYDTMGIDRCACLKGSSTIFGFPTLVIDGGSAITYTAMDAHGHIMGGGISPGVKMRLKSMNEGTGALPFIKTEDILRYIRRALDEKRPLSTFAKNTEEAMIASTLNEIGAHLRHVIRIWSEKVESSNIKTDDEEVKPDKTIAVTGGSGEIITKLLQPNSGGIVELANDVKQDYVVTWEKTLLHIGVAAALLSHVKKNYEEISEKIGGKKQAEMDPLTHKNLIGKRIAKYFDQAAEDNDHMYRGTVDNMKQTRGVLMFHVSYDDGDKEQVPLDDLQAMITKYELVGEKKSSENIKKRPREKETNRYVGARIAKRFDDGVVYYGSVISYNDEYWKIKYEDSDEEEFDIDELNKYLKFYKEQEKMNRK